MDAGTDTNTNNTPNGNTILNPTTNSDGSPQQQQQQQNQQCAVREQDRFMPIANVIRIMRKVLPSHAKISDDAKETIQECVSEYISFITSEANDRCQREQRKTITAEDVLWAMNKLGFDDYIEPLTVFLHRYREVEGDHRGSIRGDPLPPPKRTASAGSNLVVPMQPPMAAMPLAMGGDHLMQFHQLQQQQHQFGGYGEHVMGGGGYFFYGGGSVDGGGGGGGASSSSHHHHHQQQLQNNNGAGAAPNGGAFDPYSGNFK